MEEDQMATDVVGSGPSEPAPVPPTISDVLPDAVQFYEPEEIEAELVEKFPITNWSEMRKGEDRQYTKEFVVAGTTW